MLVIVGALLVKGKGPVYHMYFIELTQQLATLAAYNREKDDRLLQVGR